MINNKNIHPTAIIGEKVKLHESVKVGAYCTLDGDIEIGEGCILKSHVNIEGKTKIGKGNVFFPFCSIGTAPQDLKYAGEETELVIGDNNKFREHVTVNTGTVQDKGITKIGSNCLFMMSSHIAHDCVVGNHVILANNATLAGHVQVGDFAIIGGLSAIHQFVRIGSHAMIGGMSGIESDVIPFGSAFGERAHLRGLNLVGLKRRNFDKEQINKLRKAFKDIFEGEGLFKENVTKAKADYSGNDVVEQIVAFLQSAEDRAICRPVK